MKNYIIGLSIFLSAFLLFIIGYMYLDTYKAKNNYNTLKIDTVYVEENIKPTDFLLTFNVAFGKYNTNTGPTFEQSNGGKLIVQKLTEKLIKNNVIGAKVSTGNPYIYGTTTDYLAGIKVFIPISNNLSETVINSLISEYSPKSVMITKNISDKEYEKLSLEAEYKNIKKNREQAEQKAESLNTRILDVQNNINQYIQYSEYKPMNNFIEEASDGTLKITNYTTVNYIIAK